MEKGLKRFDNVFYPIGGVANICDNIADLFAERVRGKSIIHLVVSAQLNSYPHIGTIINFMCAFAIGSHLKDKLNINVDLTFDALDNVTGENINVGDDIYFISLKNKLVDGQSISDKYLPYFEELLKKLSDRTNIRSYVRRYDEYQKDPIVRKTVIKILSDYESFAEILNPSDRHVHVRTVCPICHYGEKSAKYIKIIQHGETELILTNKCFEHGEFNVRIAENNDEFIDINAQIRDFMKGVYLIEKGKEDNSYGIMVDGGDWGGLWPLRVHVESLMKLGYSQLSGRIFTPTITDWAGTKLSKRLYVGDKAFSELQEGIINYSKFYECYGEQGFEKLWLEVNKWVASPDRFFRDYSVDYLDLVLNS